MPTIPREVLSDPIFYEHEPLRMRSGKFKKGDIVEIDVYLGGEDFAINQISFEELCKCRVGVFFSYRDALYETKIDFGNGKRWDFPERCIKKFKEVE